MINKPGNLKEVVCSMWKKKKSRTKITLYLKEDQLEYLEWRRMKDLIKKHSELISYPISLWVDKTTTTEVSDYEKEEGKIKEEEEEGKAEDVEEEK